MSSSTSRRVPWPWDARIATTAPPPKPLTIGDLRTHTIGSSRGTMIGSYRPTPKPYGLSQGFMLLPQADSSLLIARKQTHLENLYPSTAEYDSAPVYRERTFQFRPTGGMGEPVQSAAADRRYHYGINVWVTGGLFGKGPLAHHVTPTGGGGTAFLPPFPGFCVPVPAAPWCSVFATDGGPWFTDDGVTPGTGTGICSVYTRDDFPPYTTIPAETTIHTIVFDGIFPAALPGAPVPSVDLFQMFFWIHIGLGPGETIGTSANCGARMITPDGTTIHAYGPADGGFAAAPGNPETPHRLHWDPGGLVATTANPIRVQIYADSTWHTEFTDRQIEWGAALWSDQWCEDVII